MYIYFLSFDIHKLFQQIILSNNYSLIS